MLSQIPSLPIDSYTATKQVGLTPFAGSPILTLTNNEVPFNTGSQNDSGFISGSTIYVRDTWTIPTGSNTIIDRIQNNYTQTDHVPGPLPLLGAGAAFGFSRRIRSRIKGARLV